MERSHPGDHAISIHMAHTNYLTVERPSLLATTY